MVLDFLQPFHELLSCFVKLSASKIVVEQTPDVGYIMK